MGVFASAATEKAEPAKAGRVAAPFLGTITLLVAAGDRVDTGTPVAMIEAMKMEALVTAPRAGTVSQVLVHDGQQVEGGVLIAQIG